MPDRREALDRLSKALVLAEAALYALNPGVRDWVLLPCRARLYWSKEGGKWGLYVEEHDGMFTRIHNAKIDLRMEASYALDGLLLSLQTSAQAAADNLEHAAAAAEAFADRVLEPEQHEAPSKATEVIDGT